MQEYYRFDNSVLLEIRHINDYEQWGVFKRVFKGACSFALPERGVLRLTQKGLFLFNYLNSATPKTALSIFLVCPPGRSWVACGAQCVKTCNNYHLPCLDNTCQEGCICPKGMVLHNKQCINSSQCLCHHGGQRYRPGEKIKVDCNIWYVSVVRFQDVSRKHKLNLQYFTFQNKWL